MSFSLGSFNSVPYTSFMVGNKVLNVIGSGEASFEDKAGDSVFELSSSSYESSFSELELNKNLNIQYYMYLLESL